MPISFPTTGLTPNVTTYTYSGLTWLWTGSVWQSVGTVSVQGTQGIQGAQGIQGTQGIQGSTPLLSATTPTAVGTAAAGISTSASRDDHVHSIANVAYTNVTNTFATSQNIYGSVASNASLAVRGAASQSADILSVQNSAGQAGFGVTASGGIQVRSAFNGPITVLAGATGDLSSMSVYTYNIARKGIVIKGLSGQTANLVEMQDYLGNPLSAVDPAGNFTKGDGDQLVLASQIF